MQAYVESVSCSHRDPMSWHTSSFSLAFDNLSAVDCAVYVVQRTMHKPLVSGAGTLMSWPCCSSLLVLALLAARLPLTRHTLLPLSALMWNCMPSRSLCKLLRVCRRCYLSRCSFCRVDLEGSWVWHYSSCTGCLTDQLVVAVMLCGRLCRERCSLCTCLCSWHTCMPEQSNIQPISQLVGQMIN